MNYNLRRRADAAARPAVNGARFLCESELAERLGLSNRTVQGWRCRGGGPPFVRFGRIVRYPEAALEEWLKASAAKAD